MDSIESASVLVLVVVSCVERLSASNRHQGDGEPPIGPAEFPMPESRARTVPVRSDITRHLCEPSPPEA